MADFRVCLRNKKRTNNSSDFSQIAEKIFDRKNNSKTGMKIYFSNPYSSWERGTNENTNGLIRRYLPKGTDFNLVDEKYLMKIQEKLNNRPRKIIGYKKPKEMMDLELKFAA